MSDILVVEGIITDDETTIRLIRSVDITETVFSFVYVDDAKVYVEYEDGTICPVIIYGGIYV